MIYTLRDIFPLQVIETDKEPMAFFLVPQARDENGEVKINMERKTKFEAFADEDSAYNAIYQKLCSIVQHKQPRHCGPWGSDEQKQISAIIAKNSARGEGNLMLGDLVIYLGRQHSDCVAQIIKNNLGYYVFIHPAAELYIEPIVRMSKI